MAHGWKTEEEAFQHKRHLVQVPTPALVTLRPDHQLYHESDGRLRCECGYALPAHPDLGIDAYIKHAKFA